MATASVKEVKIAGDLILVTVVGETGILARKDVIGYLQSPGNVLVQKSFTTDKGNFGIVFVVQNQTTVKLSGLIWVEDLASAIPFQANLSDTLSHDGTGYTLASI